jgi:hypothetical protein
MDDGDPIGRLTAGNGAPPLPSPAKVRIHSRTSGNLPRCLQMAAGCRPT